MACKVYETTKQINTSKCKHKQTRPSHIQLRKRQRTISFTETDPLCLSTGDSNMELTPFKQEPASEPINPRDPLNLKSTQNPKKRKYSKTVEVNNKNKESEQIECLPAKQLDTIVTKNKTYIYGNYPCYYGYRMESSQDPRMELFKSEIFQNKKCLDIGCNSGAITIRIARDFTPRFIEGIDIDPELIKRANRSVKYLLGPVVSKYPISSIGSAPTVKLEVGMFPQNISFRTHNYVLPSNEQLDRYVPDVSYDVILCLSVTKWIQLNWGDEGVRRLFMRIYKDLSPDGVLILESQNYGGYAKRAKMSPHMREHYRNMKMRPSQFAEYLTSEVGFVKREVLGAPCHSSKGFQREIELYRKSI
ncbi:7SK snRNA methylphosphate capping enzyme-like [Oopsacas minuta]|uniref:RNA methyltransferase n=1 Tax=Oopsacas minuta TaxID=111878 RepID=A0AAV7K8X2_9METZ|nr:7SK snRNA methylphosphate capping enzyme-like [Oopsacas minuta]